MMPLGDIIIEITKTYDDGKEVMGYEVMSKRLNAIIPDETWDSLERVAERELRTKSQMTAILLGEALAEYWKRNPPEPSEDSPAGETSTEEASFRASRFVDEPGRDNLVPSKAPASKAPAKAPAKAKPATAKTKRAKDSKGI